MLSACRVCALESSSYCNSCILHLTEVVNGSMQWRTCTFIVNHGMVQGCSYRSWLTWKAIFAHTWGTADLICSMSKYNTHALLIFVVLNNYMSCDMLLKPCIHGVCKSCYKFIQREGWNLLPQPPKRKEEKYFVVSKENLYNVMCTCAVCGFVLVDDAYHCDNTTHVLLRGNNHKQYMIVASIPESSPDPTLEEGKGLVTVQHFLGSCKFNILVILCVSQI